MHLRTNPLHHSLKAKVVRIDLGQQDLNWIPTLIIISESSNSKT